MTHADATHQPLPRDPVDPPTLRDLLPRHLPRIEDHVRRHLHRSLRDRESASDLVASVCGDLLAEGVTFEYRDEAQFGNWLHVVVLNKIRNRLRFHGASKRNRSLEIDVSASQFEAAQVAPGSPSQLAILREDLSRLDEALAQLSTRHRDVIVRTHLRGESHAQVAAALGRTEEATRALLTRALVKLATALDRQQGGAG